MSSHSGSDQQEGSSKTPTTIKIAAKDSSLRAGGPADPGPGDPNAEPSQAPELVSIPQPPTASQLVVKSTNSRVIKTINDPVSLSHKTHTGTLPGEGAPRESTSSKALSASPSAVSGPAMSHHSTSGSGPAAGGLSAATGAGSGRVPGSAPKSSSARGAAGSERSQSSVGGGTAHFSMKSPAGASGRPTSASSGNVQDEVEEGEGEIEHPPESPAPGGSGGAGPKSSTATGGGLDSAAPSSGSKKSPKSGSRSPIHGAGGTTSGSELSDTDGGKSGASGKKKITKFRYHKRITVRTHGKTSPSVIMEKVNKKDHKKGITPSTIEDMDTQELMKRAGIKGKKNSHWRVRLRQTKRMTKNGKTVTQTKVAYRDSEGNKRVKTVDGPNCKNCGKKLEECKCDD